MKNQNLFKSMLFLLLGLVCSVALAQTATIQVSTNVTTPEHLFEIKSSANHWMTSFTSPSDKIRGCFAFFDDNDDTTEDAYKIFSVTHNKWVSYTKSISYSNGKNKAVLVNTQEEANAWNATINTSDSNDYYVIAPYQNDGTVASFYWNWHGGTSGNPYNNVENTVGLYNDKADGGSLWVLSKVTETATANDVTLAVEKLNGENFGKVGYPKTNTPLLSLYDQMVGVVSTTTLNNIELAYKTCSDIVLPEDGKAYKIENYSLSTVATTRYLNYTAGRALSVSTQESDASVFLCHELSAGVYVLITEDGKVLTWPHSGEGFMENSNRYGYSNNYGTVYSNYSDWNKITIKKNGTNEKDFGHLRLVARRYARDNSPNSSFIVKGSDGSWDRAGDSYYLDEVGPNWYSSAWIFTEVAHTKNQAQNLALAKIDAIEDFSGKAGNLGNDIGYAYYMVGDTKSIDADAVKTAINNATTVDEVNAIKNSYSVMLPEFGKAYKMTLVANNNERTQYHLVAENATLSASTEEEGSVFYCLQSTSANYPYVFISEDGYVLAYHALTETYTSAGDRNNFKVEGMINKTSGNITSNVTNRLGTVCITTGKRSDDDDRDGCVIYKYTGDGAFDSSDSPFHNGTYTSAIIMTEVADYQIPDAQQTKINDILGKDAVRTSVEGIRDELKNQLGYYYCTINGEKYYNADDILAIVNSTSSLKTLADIVAAVNGKTLIVPEVGKYYRIKGKASGKYIDATGISSGQMNLKSEAERGFLGSIFLVDEGNRLYNVGAEKYMKETHSIGADKNGANTWQFISSSTGYFKLKSNYSSPWLHDNTTTNKADRCSSDGDLHEFSLEEVSANSLFIDAPAKIGATATWNGLTKTLPAKWTLFEGMEVSNPAFSFVADNVNYIFDGLFEDGVKIETPTTIDALNTDRTITAKFSPAFFSEAFGDKWVNFTRAADASHAAILTSNEVNAVPIFNTFDYANMGTLWSLVGDINSFKIYNRLSGDGMALSWYDNTPGNGEVVKMVAANEAISWHLIEYDNGYAIAPVGNNEKGINSYTGAAGSQLKFYGVSDKGTHWNFALIDTEKPLTLSVQIEGEQPYANNTRVAHWGFASAGNTTTTIVKSNIAPLTYYFPLGATFSLSNSVSYRGYIFNGFVDEDGNAVDTDIYTNATLPDGGLNLTASYSVDENNKYQYLAYSNDEVLNKPYRIPAITTTRTGRLIAAYDFRPGGGDVGQGEVDIMVRTSDDNGETWTEEMCIANSTGASQNLFDSSFGDAAIVADRESDEVLIMHVGGRVFYGNANASNRPKMGKIVSHNNGDTWENPTDMSAQFIQEEGSLFPNAHAMFFGSGRIIQSRVYKKPGSDYYRIYGALLVKNHAGGSEGDDNFVVYSDDFGANWHLLGGMCCDGGNEPKVEELPDGTIILSSRKSSGRYFNVFTYTNKETGAGEWSSAVQSNAQTGGISFGSNSCNGEIYKVKAVHKKSGRICDVMLQSVPTDNARSKVSVYYKEMDYTEAYTPTTFAQNWTKGLEVSSIGSAYSTMTLQADGNFGFFYEEEPNGYCLVYVPLSLDEITNGAYSLYTVSSTIGEHKVGTFYATEAMQIPEGVRAYVATEAPVTVGGASKIHMTELSDIIPANTGAVLRADEAKAYEFIPSISYGTPVDGNMLVGYEAADNDAESYKEFDDVPTGSYVLTVKNEKAAFYRWETSDPNRKFRVYNNKAYLQVPEAGNARAIYFSFDDEDATGIIETESENVKAQIYDLSGRRVQNVQKGIYIVNGNKVLK